MLVICPFAHDIAPQTRAFLDQSGLSWTSVNLAGLDTGYAELLGRLWSKPRDFCLVEHDIVPFFGALKELHDCPELWCAYSYELGAGLHAGLGCTRFRAELIARVPDAIEATWKIADEVHPAGHWCSLDDRLTQVLTERDVKRHIHQSTVAHLNPFPTHGCVFMRLNLGCGEFYADGWVNVDFQSPHRKDVEVDIRQELPFETKSIAGAYLGHVLEHLTLDEALVVLCRLRPLMISHAEVMVVGPDVQIAREMLRAGEIDLDQYHLIREGGHRWPGDDHLWLCDAEQVADLLKRAGFLSVESIDIANVSNRWPVVSRIGWQCAVKARA